VHVQRVALLGNDTVHVCDTIVRRIGVARALLSRTRAFASVRPLRAEHGRSRRFDAYRRHTHGHIYWLAERFDEAAMRSCGAVAHLRASLSAES
jgi:hypothetical protein